MSFLLLGATLVGLFVILSNWVVNQQSKDRLFDEIKMIPENEVGLILGTAPTYINGNVNPYFQYRIEAAAVLFKAGKVKHLIVSGDNSRESYNEPAAMQEALVAIGIPEKAISLDYAGFRTLDSVVRCREVFQQTHFTIISQPFHNARAVFLAKAKGMDVIAFNATKVELGYWNKTLLRELAARSKAIIDILLVKKPKFLGEKVDLPIKK